MNWPIKDATLDSALDSLTVAFIENVDQFASGVRFQAVGTNSALWVAEEGLWITLHNPAMSQRAVNLRLTFVDAVPAPRIEPIDRQNTVVNYIIGNDPSKWHTHVPVFRGVRYVELYPGIDLEIGVGNGQWQPRLVVRDQTNLDLVRLRVEGAQAIMLESDHVRLTTEAGDLVLPLLALSGVSVDHTLMATSPTLEGNDILHPFAATLDALNQNSFTLPNFLFSTFLGGSGDGATLGGSEDDTTFPVGIGDDKGKVVGADSSGVYIVGSTFSYNFPVTSGAFDTSPGNNDAFVVLQPQLCKATELAAAIVAGFGTGLVASPPNGPGENKLNRLKHFPNQPV